MTPLPSKVVGPLVDHGLENRAWFKNKPTQGDPDYIHFFDDFLEYAFVPTNTTTNWLQLEDSNASMAIEADVLGGRLLLTTSANDDQGTSIQSHEMFEITVNKELWFETKINLLDATESEFCSGLTITFATAPENILTRDDRIVFEKLDGNDDIICVTEFSGSETRTNSGIDIVAATDITLGFRVIGDSVVQFFVNRVLVRTHTTDIVNDQNLAVASYVLAGDSAGTTLAIDYIAVTATR